jgi:hypothetical protein
MMQSSNHEEERYRVLLRGVDGNSSEKREAFCRNISEKYRVSFALMENILDRCPIVLKKNLTFRKAEGLARTLKQYGGQISVEERRDTPPILLEFQQGVPRLLALESSQFRKTPGGMWSVTGRVKNIGDAPVHDVWVLVQLFENPETLLTFEEVPLVLNPLPVGEASPFRVLLDADRVIRRVSVAFKNSAGAPLSTEDRRKVREWTEVEIEDEGEHASTPLFSTADGGPQTLDVTEPQDGLPGEREAFTEEDSPGDPGPSDLPASVQETSAEDTLVSALKAPPSFSEANVNGARLSGSSFAAPFGFEETESEMNSAPTGQEPLPEEALESLRIRNRDVSVFQEATKLLDEIDRRIDRKQDPVLPSFPWMEQFRDAIRSYELKQSDPFSPWFQANKEDGRFESNLHFLVTILAHARFEQAGEEGEALENTKRVVPLIMRSNLSLEEIPPLEATRHFSAESWRHFFCKAIPRLHVIGRDIAARGTWDASELERLIQVIPHMSGRTSRRAVRWMSQLVPEVLTIDFSNTPVIIGESLFRVATRLGVVMPQFDTYQNVASMGYTKLQSFAKEAFPHDPAKLEEPMTSLGMNGGTGGHCTPTRPRCEGCPFEGFCPRLDIPPIPAQTRMKENGETAVSVERKGRHGAIDG